VVVDINAGLRSIIKRDGRIVPFDSERIRNAIFKCFSRDNNWADKPDPNWLTDKVYKVVIAKFPDTLPTVEQIQDIVEIVLQSEGLYDDAKHYILFRAERAKLRDERPVPIDVKEAFEEASKYFPTPIQQFQFFDKYARFDWNKGRRETWIETVDRAVNYLKELVRQEQWIRYQNKGSIMGIVGEQTFDRIRKAILNMEVMPSMRLLAMAGPAAERQNICIYNCSFLPIDSIDSFVEALLISMNGCGVGFSVESEYVEGLPRVRKQTGKYINYQIPDTTEGWGETVRIGYNHWFDGNDVIFDYSLLRPPGAILKVKGGRSSGPDALRKMLDFSRERILARQGRYLRPIDAHDLVCSIGSAAISGGMRRTAMLSLFDYDDIEMLRCNQGNFERDNSQRWNANNSAVWPEQGVNQIQVLEQVLEMYRSERGEPGIFNRKAAITYSPERRKSAHLGTNPCGEILLRPYQFCNLSVAVARKDDNWHTLKDKVEIATIIGTIQSLATNFPGLRPIWKQNCEEERLLGVDITGQMDCPIVQSPETMRFLKSVAIQTNKEYADKLGINQSASITCVKPSGNSSQLLNCSSGLHARWAKFYERNVRVSATSPIFKVFRDSGVPMDPENGQVAETANTWVVHFPIKSPDGAITRNDRSAVEQCEYWLLNKEHWTEHNPSVTITYRPEELLDVANWIWKHQHLIGGMAFLPADDAKYEQLPYIEISEEKYNDLVSKFPPVDYSKIWRYEQIDMTTAAQELACVSGVCEIDEVEHVHSR
jgi:ribonucleoside-triphosphate reductase